MNEVWSYENEQRDLSGSAYHEYYVLKRDGIRVGEIDEEEDAKAICRRLNRAAWILRKDRQPTDEEIARGIWLWDNYFALIAPHAPYFFQKGPDDTYGGFIRGEVTHWMQAIVGDTPGEYEPPPAPPPRLDKW